MFKTIEEFAKITGMSACFIRKLCRTPDFPVIKVGCKYMIDSEAAIQFLKDRASYRDYMKIKTRRKA